MSRPSPGNRIISTKGLAVLRSLRTNRILWLTLTLLALIATLAGVFCPRIYDPVVSNEIMACPPRS